MGEADQSSHSPPATLSPTTAKSRFGVAYMRAICSQAGIGFAETSPDEDVLAIDGEVQFDIASARVQVKCTGQFRINHGKTASWPVTPEWRDKWTNCCVPVYFVLVIVDPDVQDRWLDHHDDSTLHRAAAFWTRVDTMSKTLKLAVPKSQRLTAKTLTTWADDVSKIFAPTRGGGDG